MEIQNRSKCPNGYFRFGSVMDIVITTVSSVFSGLVTTFLGIIFAIYLLVGKDRIGSQFIRLMNRYLKIHRCGKIHYVMSILNDYFHRYIVGQCTEAVILGDLSVLGMLILRMLRCLGRFWLLLC